MMKTKTLSRSLTASLAFAIVATVAGQTWAQSGASGSARSYLPQSQQRQAAATQPTTQQQIQQVARNNQTQVGLEGYCPVCLIKISKWVAGKPNHSAVYDGKTYFFPGNDTLQEFVSNPAKYVPALGGDCTVCYEKMGKRVPGNVRFASMHENRLYLFPSDKERSIFNESRQAFEDTDLALDGNCIVCQAKMNKAVPGSTKFTAIHDGFRYLFPSDRERQAFAQSPQKYVTAIAKPKMDKVMSADRQMHKGEMQGEMKKGMHDTSMMKRGSLDGMASATQVQFQGKTACAGCEFGVAPLGAPDELGLAVTTEGGKIYVIEEGHTRWPQIYKGRFEGQQVAVSGTIVKTSGNVAWVKPSQLTAL